MLGRAARSGRRRPRCAPALDAGAARGERSIELAADDAIVTRLTDAAILPDLLARETVTTVQDVTGMGAVVAFVAVRGSDPRLLAFCGCDGAEALALARAAADGGTRARRRAAAHRAARQGGRRPAFLRRHRPRHRSPSRSAAASGCSPRWRARDSSCAASASARRRPPSSTASARSNRCCPASSAPAPPWPASPTRFSACRGRR